VGETTKLDFWTELAQSLRTADRVLAGIGPERATEPIPLWHTIRRDPPRPDWYLVIARLDDGERAGEYVVQRDHWAPDPYVCWAGEDRFGRALPGSVVAWAEEP
jgi:hypothetical protein